MVRHAGAGDEADITADIVAFRVIELIQHLNTPRNQLHDLGSDRFVQQLQLPDMVNRRDHHVGVRVREAIEDDKGMISAVNHEIPGAIFSLLQTLTEEAARWFFIITNILIAPRGVEMIHLCLPERLLGQNPMQRDRTLLLALNLFYRQVADIRARGEAVLQHRTEGLGEDQGECDQHDDRRQTVEP